ncbi:hypothetical protein EC586_07570 [Helicobacter pylori]|nr:hypothetical protein ECC34_07295 [Helicobacter pylori]RVZ74612.1 hypothetical protein EC586_07570 [Helicobacter pylori]
MIVRNASSVSDFYSFNVLFFILCWCCFFISFVFKFFSLGFFGGGVECVLKWFLCFRFLEPI